MKEKIVTKDGCSNIISLLFLCVLLMYESSV